MRDPVVYRRIQGFCDLLGFPQDEMHLKGSVSTQLERR